MASINASQSELASLLERLDSTRIQPQDSANALLAGLGSSPLTEAQTLSQLLRRPEVSLRELLPIIADDFSRYSYETLSRAEIETKYAGYILRQLRDIDKRRYLEETSIPEDFLYDDLEGVAIEAREKLSRLRPASLGQASRIAGVSPSDISVLSLYVKAAGR
jgi:tRNA uridine 5-carboxymethylaminomethyl modification enzyme